MDFDDILSALDDEVKEIMNRDEDDSKNDSSNITNEEAASEQIKKEILEHSLRLTSNPQVENTNDDDSLDDIDIVWIYNKPTLK